MGPKILWVLLPLLLYGVLLVLAWRGRAPSRLSVNMHGSLLLMVYLLCTAGLGIFWVANQQLPVFDWHYLFGYATLLLVGLHLFFNLPVLVRWLRRNAPATPSMPATPASPATTPPAPAPRRSPMRARTLAGLLAVPLALFAAFWLGAQFAGAPATQRAAPDDPIQAVLRFHEYSSESRTSAFRRAPVPALDVQPPVFKSYPTAPHIPLERGTPAQDGRTLAAMLRGPGATRPLTLAALGQILFLSAGVTAHRGGLALRAAPSSGALFPAELYIAVRRVDGLPAGLYHYDPEHHRLDSLGVLPPSLAPVIGDAGALVVVAAVFDRTAWKYRNRAYRYVAADLGHLLENLRLTGHYAGLPVHLPVLFHESQLAHAFNLDSRQEGVLALAHIGGTPATAAPPPASPAARTSPASGADIAAEPPRLIVRRVAPDTDGAAVRRAPTVAPSAPTGEALRASVAGRGAAGVSAAGVGALAAGSANVGAAGAVGGGAGRRGADGGEATRAGAAGLGAVDGGGAGVDAAGTGAANVGAVRVSAAGNGAAGVGAVGVEAAGVGALGVGPLGVGPLGVGAVGVGAASVEAARVGAVGVGAADVGAVGVRAAGVEAAGVGSVGAGSVGVGGAEGSVMGGWRPGTEELAAGVTGAVHAATSLKAGLAGDASQARKKWEGAEGGLVKLPRVATGEASADLYGTIVKRRSQRRFAEESVPLTELAALLAEMSQEPLLSDAVSVDLVVNRVTGMKPGVYRYLPQRHALMRVRDGRFAEEAQSAALSQDVIGNAAVVLILSADREAMFARHGARGYRLAFLEAGMMGQRWLLGATARGLAACPVGAFYDDEAAKLINVNPQQRWVLHFAALGKPAH